MKNIEKIPVNGHYVWVDKNAEIKEGEWFYNPFQGIVSVDSNSDGCKKIVSASPELKLEGVSTYLEWLAEQEYPSFKRSTPFGSKYEHIPKRRRSAFIKGYESAEKEQQIEIDALKKTIQGYQEGIDSLPTWDDVRKIIDLARDYNDGWIHSDEEIIEKIKQSKV